MAAKVARGDKLVIPAATWNDMVDAAEYHKLHRALGEGGGGIKNPISFSVVRVKNGSGAARRQGDVLQLGSPSITNLDRLHLWFDGGAIAAPLWQATHAILLQQMPSDAFGDAVVSGVCLAYVNVNNASHYRADVKASQYTLESCHAGPWEILYKPSGTGEKLCVVVMGPKRPSTGIAKLGGTLPAGSTGTTTSATATLQKRNTSTNALESANQDITVRSYYATAFSTNDYLGVAQDDVGDWWMTTKDCT